MQGRRAHRPQQWGRVRRKGSAPCQPIAERGVGQLQYGLQGRQVGVGEPGEAGADVAAQQNIHLLGAAVGGAEQQAAAARVERRRRCQVGPGVSSMMRVTYRRGVPDATPPLTAIAPLLAPLTSLRGVGPQVANLLIRVTGGTRVLDLLFHLPESFVDRRARPTIRGAVRGQVGTLCVEVVRHEAPTNPRQPWRVVVTDGTGFAELVFFKPQRAQALAMGAKLLVSGKLEQFADRLTIAHPDHIVPADQPERLPALDPVWPLTAGLFPSQVRAAMVQALALVPPLPEWHDAALMRREKWPSFLDALRALHMPVEFPGPKPRARLAYDELLAHQVAMVWVRNRERTRPGRALAGTGVLRAEALRRFGHALTASQTGGTGRNRCRYGGA